MRTYAHTHTRKHTHTHVQMHRLLMHFLLTGLVQKAKSKLARKRIVLTFLILLLVIVMFVVFFVNLSSLYILAFGMPVSPVYCPIGSQKYNLAVATIFRNSEPYLKEWLEFHIMMGIEHFYLYDNNSTDSPLTVVEPYIKSGYVTYAKWPSFSYTNWKYDKVSYSQLSAMKHAIETYRCENKWIALIDDDEFLFPLDQNKKIIDILADYENYGSLALGWSRFGSSGHLVPPDDLVINSYFQRQGHFYRNWKHILQVKTFKSMKNIHDFFFHDGYWSVDEDYWPIMWFTPRWFPKKANKLRLYHYHTKSKYDWWLRVTKRGQPNGVPWRHKMESFEVENEGSFEDRTIVRYVPALCKQMGITCNT